MLLKIHPENPSHRQILKVCDILRKGGIIVYPTDSVYALGCDINNHKAIEQIAKLKGTRPAKADFSFIFSDLSQVSDYALLFDNRIFKLMKSHLPGPFTFILHARNNVPKIFQSRKKTIGIRIPDNKIPVELVRNLGNPVMTTSIHDEDTLIEYTTDPDLIYEKYKDKVDVIINGGFGNNVPTTVVDCIQPEPVIVRQGIGIIE
jgi:tRNA threonylcarbamoyl adenosine modification protein (Sua5/YciO/YrdC/YwlC family)